MNADPGLINFDQMICVIGSRLIKLDQPWIKIDHLDQCRLALSNFAIAAPAIDSAISRTAPLDS